MATIILVGAPAHAIDAWAGHRPLDTLIGCSLALPAHSLLRPRDQPDNEFVYADPTDSQIH